LRFPVGSPKNLFFPVKVPPPSSCPACRAQSVGSADEGAPPTVVKPWISLFFSLRFFLDGISPRDSPVSPFLRFLLILVFLVSPFGNWRLFLFFFSRLNDLFQPFSTRASTGFQVFLARFLSLRLLVKPLLRFPVLCPRGRTKKKAFWASYPTSSVSLSPPPLASLQFPFLLIFCSLQEVAYPSCLRPVGNLRCICSTPFPFLGVVPRCRRFVVRSLTLSSVLFPAAHTPILGHGPPDFLSSPLIVFL